VLKRRVLRQPRSPAVQAQKVRGTEAPDPSQGHKNKFDLPSEVMHAVSG
jgi:hypothetical protein